MKTETLHKEKKSVGKLLWNFIKKEKMALIAFAIPLLILLVLYIIRDIIPFGDRLYMRMDFYHQYAPFMKEFGQKLRNGESLLFAFDNGLGINYWAQYAYYLASPINLIYLLVPSGIVVEVMNFTMVLRSGVAGLAFFLFLRKKYENENWVMVGMSAFYAVSSFYLAYSCNIIWLDCYALFPLVVMGVEELFRGKSGKWYGITMGICAISNFYFAVIMGICLLLYIVIYVFSEKEGIVKKNLYAFLKFIGITVLYVSVAAVIMLPVYLALKHTPSGGAAFPTEWESNFAFKELIQRLFINMKLILTDSKLPNIYSSVLFLLAFPLFLLNRKISVKEKVIHTLVVAFLLLSFQWNILEYLVHGFHFPNSFPARQAFFFVFLAIGICYRCYEARSGLPKAVYVVVGVAETILLSAAWVFWGADMEHKGTDIYLLSMCFIILYMFLFLLEEEKNMRILQYVFLGLCVMECCVNTWITGLDSTTGKAFYTENDVLISQMLEDIEAVEGDSFYRFEQFERKTVNDAAWNDFNGVSYFSSTMIDDVAQFYKMFGLRFSNGSYSFTGATPLVTSLLNVKYVVSDKPYPPAEGYSTQSYEDGDRVLYLHTNENVLPLGFVMDSYVAEQFTHPAERNPYLVHNLFVNAVLGSGEDLYTLHEVYEKTASVEAEDGAEINEETAEVQAFRVKENEVVSIFVTNTEKITVKELNLDTGEEVEYSLDGLEYRQNVSFFCAPYPREISISPKDKGEPAVAMLCYKMNQEVLDKTLDILGQSPLEITEWSHGKVKGTLNAQRSGIVFLSIPYDEGWKVKVDGQDVEIKEWEDAMLSFDVSMGEHEISLSYVPPGFVPGLCISIVGIVVSAFLLFRKKEKLEKQA